MQQQRNVLKKRTLDLEGELQVLQSERWRTLELEVAVKDFQRERDTLQGQNTRLLAMAEERAAHGQDQRLHVVHLEERFAEEMAQRATLQERLRAVEKELAEVKSRPVSSPLAPSSRRNSVEGEKKNSLLTQVGRLEADLTREMRERVHMLQMLEKLQGRQHQVPPPRVQTIQQQDSSTVEHSEQVPVPCTSTEHQPELRRQAGSHKLPELSLPCAADASNTQPLQSAGLGGTCSVGCMTEPDPSSSPPFQLDKCVQATLEEGRGELSSSQPPRVPSLEQSKLAVMSRAAPQGTALRIPTLAESARIPDEPQSEATDADVSLVEEKSPGEVSSESVIPVPPDKSQGDVTCKNTRIPGSSSLLEKSPGELSFESVRSEKPHDSCSNAVKSQGEGSSYVDTTDGGHSFISDKVFMADHLETLQELEKSRDLLRVQCRINSSLENEVAQLRQQLGQTETGHTRQMAELRRRLEERTPPRHPRPAPHGLFQLHVGHLQLSAPLAEGRSLFLSWVFCDQKVSSTPPHTTNLSVDYQYSTVYQVDVDRSFLDYLRNEECEVELYSLNEQGSWLEGRGSLRFAELLQFPHNRLHTTVSLVSPDGRNPVGTVHCWFRLACDTDLPTTPEDPTTLTHNTLSSTPVPVPRMVFPFSQPVSSGADFTPTPAPRSTMQPLRQDATSDSAATGGGGEGSSEENAARMKQLADSVLRQQGSTEDRLAQILEAKWRERKRAAASHPVSSGFVHSSQEHSFDESHHVGVVQELEVWLEYLWLQEDSEAMLSEDKQQFQVRCSFPSRGGPTTVTTPPVYKEDAVHGTFMLHFHTTFKLDEEQFGSKHPTLLPQDLDCELFFVIGYVLLETGNLQPFGSASADVLEAARSVVDRAELRLEVADSAGNIVGELGVSASLRHSA